MDPLAALAILGAAAQLCRLVSLAIVLRGTAPDERPPTLTAYSTCRFSLRGLGRRG
jgi:hypothetical protein